MKLSMQVSRDSDNSYPVSITFSVQDYPDSDSIGLLIEQCGHVEREIIVSKEDFLRMCTFFK